jgi:L-asparaginase
MRPSTALSADGPLNLFNGVAVAASKEAIGKGVLVVFNDQILSARDVTKTNTSNVAAFKSNNSGPIGLVNYGKAKFYYQPLRTHTKKSIFNINKLKKLPKVEIIYGYANQPKFMIENLLDNNVEAVIYAGVGNGNIYKESLDSLIKARENGLILVRSSRVGSGFVIPNAEINDDEYGFISSDNLNPQKARILLMLALTKSKNSKKIQKLFWEY